MKCNNCGSEWSVNTKYSQISSCPFCGASLIKIETSSKETTMMETMKLIFQQFGTDIILQKNKFISIFVDYAPRLKKEKKILSVALDENIADFFVNCEVEEREANIRKARRAMNLIMSESAIDLVISSFIDALDWEIGTFDQKHGEVDSVTLYSTEIPDWIYAIGNAEELSRIIQANLIKIEKSGIVFNQQRFEKERNDKRFQYACDELNKENYAVALKIFDELAGNPPNKIGSALAGVKLAQMYYWGEGVEVDKMKSAMIMLYFINCQNPLVIAWISEYYRISIPNFTVKSSEISKMIYDICSKELKLMADLGDPDAQYFLGFNLIRGINCEKNEKAGFAYIMQSSKAKDVHASILLAKCYIDGLGIDKDIVKGIRILLNFENSVCPQIQYNLGLVYYLDKYRDYVSGNYTKAFKYFLNAATYGCISAQDYVGDMYYYGYGVKTNYDSAKYWYSLAASEGSIYSTAQLGTIYYYGKGVSKDEDRAFQYFKTAADKGNAYSQYILHEFYFFDGKYKNYELGRKYLEKAANSGDIDSQKLLAKMYLSDFGFYDESKFVHWIRKAAEQGDSESERIFGEAHIILNNDKVLPKDCNKAIVWLEKAVIHGDIEAIVRLMEVYSQGIYTPVDISKIDSLFDKLNERMDNDASKESIATLVDRITNIIINLGEYSFRQNQFDSAFSYFEKANATDETGRAAKWLSSCYKNGFGVKKSRKKAKELLEEAAKKAYIIAKNK